MSRDTADAPLSAGRAGRSNDPSQPLSPFPTRFPLIPPFREGCRRLGPPTGWETHGVDQPDKSKIVTGSHPHALVEAALQMRRTMTEAEAMLWRFLRANRLGGLQFRRQQVIDRFIADFYCHAAALVVEVDGGLHDRQAARDAERDQAIASRGFRVLRFSNEQIMRDTQAVLREILRVAREMRAAQGADRPG